MYNKLESENISNNEVIFETILDIYTQTIKKDFIFKGCNNAIDKVLSLKHSYVYDSPYCDIFFDLLKLYGYNFKQEIKDAIDNLGRLENPNDNKAIIESLLKSPVIQDISFNGRDKFTIYSEQFGTTYFTLASHYFNYVEKIKEYIKHEQLNARCHHHTLFLADILPDFYAITALCKYYFYGNYYHSFTYNPDENVIIDLCVNAVLDKDRYYYLYEAKDIVKTKNSDFSDIMRLVDQKSLHLEDYIAPLRLALYKQYLDYIGYNGSLKEAPSLK